MGPPIFMGSATRRSLTHQLRMAIQRRGLSDAHSQSFKAIVVGAGPAGIATVGTLLDTGVAPVMWIDRRFNGGRLNERYRQVPSNTKVKLFIDFAQAVAPFRSIVDNAKAPNAFATLKGLEQGRGCQIKYAADLCLQLTEGLKHEERIGTIKGAVQKVRQDREGLWHVSSLTEGGSASTASAPLLVFCTGSSPNKPVIAPQYRNLEAIDLDTALNPPALGSILPSDQDIKVALIGASHSAILVLRNLYELARSSHPKLHIKWFSRHPLRYAVDKGDWILRDNTGLKGETALWAKDNLEDDRFSAADVSKYVEKISTAGKEPETYAQHLPSCQKIVEATGYTTDPTPELFKEEPDGNVVQFGKTQCDHTTGGFIDGNGNKIQGLYGAGIAFPERVKDPEGNVEMAVGLWKFMKYLKRVVPEWK